MLEHQSCGVVPVSAEKCPWFHLGSKGSTTVQKYCPNRWQLVWEEVWLSHHGICLCNPFLKLYAVLDTQHLLKVMSFVCSTDFCYFFLQPAVLQFGDLIIFSQFLQLSSRLFLICTPTLAMYHCQKHLQGQVLWYRCDCTISPDKSFLTFLQDWDACKHCHETLRPYGLVPLHSSLYIHLFLSCRRL